MAGPFKVDPNSAPEIAGAQQTGGASTVVPRSSFISDVTGLLGAAAPVIEQREKGKAQEALRDKLSSITSALKAARFPNVQTELFTEEGMVNPANKAAIKELQKWANAFWQGKLALPYVIERMNVTVNEAITAAPEWAPELNQVARDMLGFNPQHRMMGELLSAPSEAKQKLTAEEEGLNDAKRGAAKLGVTVEAYQKMSLQKMKGELEAQEYALDKTRDTYTAEIMAKDVRLSSGKLASDFYEAMQTDYEAGGAVNPQQLRNRILIGYNVERQRLLAGMPPNVEQSVITSNLKVLDDQRDTLLALTNDVSQLTAINNENRATKAIAERNLYALEKVGPIFASLGPQAGATLMSAIMQYGDNPSALPLYMRSGQPGAAIWNLANQLDAQSQAVVRHTKGVPAADKEEKAADVVMTGNVLKTPGLTGEKVVPLIDRSRQAGGDSISVLSLSQNQVVSNLSAVKEAHPQLINLYQSELSRLERAHRELAQSGAIPPGGVVMQGNTIKLASWEDYTGGVKPSYSSMDTGNTTGQGGTQYADPRAAKYNVWVQKMNNLMGYANKYQSTGVLPSTVFTNAGQVATDFNDLALGYKNEKALTRTAVRGPDGKLRFEE